MPGATVTQRICAIAGFYKHAVEEELPAQPSHQRIRRSRLPRGMTMSGSPVRSLRCCAGSVSPRRGGRAPSGPGAVLSSLAMLRSEHLVCCEPTQACHPPDPPWPAAVMNDLRVT